MKTILVLCGGRSTEHEVSLRSAASIINGLDRNQYAVAACYIDKEGRFLPVALPELPVQSADLILSSPAPRLQTISAFCDFVAALQQTGSVIALPVIHGQTGEDGEIQGFLQTLGVAYAGNRLTASALCMDKGFANDVLRAAGIPEADYFVLCRSELQKDDAFPALRERIEHSFGFPCYIKPANNGSSVGVHRAMPESLEEAVRDALRYDRRIVIEQEIRGHEVEVSILGNAHPEASLPGSYTSSHEVLDYEAKYQDRATIENIPHPLPPEVTKEVQALALRAYQALGCEGFARVDLFVGEDHRLYINEINTFPGMTASSLAPKLFTQLTDMTFAAYLDRIISNAEASESELAAIENSWENA